MFKKYSGKVLEDMVVAIAEVVATLFLDCSSFSSLSPHGEMWQTFLLPSILSSRSLERFRNEVPVTLKPSKEWRCSLWDRYQVLLYLSVALCVYSVTL